MNEMKNPNDNTIHRCSDACKGEELKSKKLTPKEIDLDWFMEALQDYKDIELPAYEFMLLVKRHINDAEIDAKKEMSKIGNTCVMCGEKMPKNRQDENLCPMCSDPD